MSFFSTSGMFFLTLVKELGILSSEEEPPLKSFLQIISHIFILFTTLLDQYDKHCYC
jgi:hypothetical protein